MIKALIDRVMARGLGRNALFAMMQSLTVTVCLFLAYRLLVADQGVAALGLWSLLMVFGGIAASFDVSGTSALARFVARHDIDFPTASPAHVIHTVLLTGIMINAVLLLLVLASVPWVLPRLVEAGDLAQSYDLMIWVAALMLLNPIALGLSTAIDGVMRADVRAMLVTMATIVGLLVNIFAIPRLGIAGLAMGQLVQQLLVIGGGWLVLRRHIVGLGWAPVHWRTDIFRATTGYALRLNLAGVLAILLEPLTKFCVNLAGGTAAVGLYELAARLAMQLRALVVSATMPLVPAFAALRDPSSPESMALVHRTQAILSLAAIVVAVLSLLGAPVLSVLILGEVSADMLRMNALLAFGWSINIIGAGFYFFAQGQGILRWNLIAHAAIGLCVGAFAIASAGNDAIMVVAGTAAGLLSSMAITIAGNARQFGIMAVARKEAPLILLAILVIAGLCSGGFAFAPKIGAILGAALR